MIELKGGTVHAPGNAISSIVDSIMKDRRDLIPVSTYLDGEYGCTGVSIGVPAVVGRRGVERILELDLDESERAIFDAGVQNVKSAISAMSL